MPCLADTNVAARRVLFADAQHAVVRAALDALRAQGETVFITPQVLIEFHALATRPVAANGLGLSSAQARVEARRIEAVFPLRPDTPAVYPLWCALADAHGVVGRQVYDARLVAVMQAHGVPSILTFNGNHFRRFPGVTVLDPAALPSPPPQP